MSKKLISIITPCFNESANVVACYEAVKQIFENKLINYKREHIFCDNASNDDTLEHLKKIAERDKCVKIIVNSRNFGILKSTYNGVLSSRGDAIVLFLPVDLQDPPSILPTFVEHWQSGYEIVYGIRKNRQENILLAFSRKLYYRLLQKLTYVEYPLNVGDYQLIDKCVLNSMRQIDDARPFMRVMTFDCGFRSIGVPYTWTARKHGKSKNTFLNLFEQGLNGLVSFSAAPLRASLLIGFLISAMSLMYALSIFFLTLFRVIRGPSGIPTIITALFFFSGVQLFFLGVLGEYIYAIFNQVRRKPLVFERERVNFDVTTTE